MTKLELLEIIQNGENSGIEFKRDERGNRAFNDDFAKEVVAFSNLKGGKIFIGVEDDGSISGLTGTDCEEWVMNICRTLVSPGVIPYYEEIQVDSGKRVAVVHIDMGFSKPYYVERSERRTYYIRVGSTSREATREELGRLFQESGIYHYDVAPIPQTSIEELSMDKVKKYFLKYLGIKLEGLTDIEIKNMLINADIMQTTEYGDVLSVGGLLLFGKRPQKFLPHSAVTFAYFKSEHLSDELIDRKVIEGTLTELIDETVRAIQRNLKAPSKIRGLKRIEKVIPKEVLREAITNAVAHRNYSIGADIRVYIFSNRIEVRNPGALPNTVTIEKIKIGSYSFPRNPLIAQHLRDLKYIDKLGRGVQMILTKMRELGFKEPGLKEEGEEFILTLFTRQ
ncbi:MAG: ATP-binding protein [Thermodesulfovibrionia bacterium]|nr:ATP-binding protein [Thermodesulfovibrionia bacterium]